MITRGRTKDDNTPSTYPVMAPYVTQIGHSCANKSVIHTRTKGATVPLQILTNEQDGESKLGILVPFQDTLDNFIFYFPQTRWRK